LALIILADDDADTRNVLGHVLRSDGHVVCMVADGEELITAFVDLSSRGDPPQVIVTDIEMPRRDGLEAVRELRRRNIEVPAVFVTAHREPEVVAQARALGVALLLKPLDLGALKLRIAELVGGSPPIV